MGIVIVGLALEHSCAPTKARDPAGRYAGSPLHDWFDGLKSGKGPCCSDADGAVIKETDWEAVDGHYRVRMPFDGDTLLADPRLVEAAGDKVTWKWIDVPDEAVIKEPNRFGQTMVWASGGNSYFIRCFMPGSMT